MSENPLYRDPRYQRFRLKALERAGWRCERCGAGHRSLHVHHLLYVRGAKPWQYALDCVQVLCDVHHRQAHRDVRQGELDLQ
jgi:hypothetical protein